MRALYQKNMGLSISTARLVATYIRLPAEGHNTPEKEASEIRCKIVRYLNLAPALACQTFTNPGGKVFREKLDALVTDEGVPTGLAWRLVADVSGCSGVLAL